MDTLKGLVGQSTWDAAAGQLDAAKIAVFGGPGSSDWKKFVIPSAIALTSTALLAFALGEKLRARKHECIPLLAADEIGYYGGHLEGISGKPGFYPWVLDRMQKENFPKISCIITPGPRRWICLQDPKLVKYVFDTHFNDISKGENFPQEYHEVVGEGIFGSDGKAWKLQRKAASQMFAMKNMKSMMYDITKKNVQIGLDKMRELMKTDPVIDLKDLFGRFTLDTFAEIAFGVNLGATAAYPEPHEFCESFDNMVVLIERRESDVFWKVKRKVGYGEEKIIADAYVKVNKFANDIIAKKEQGLMKPSFDDVRGQKLDLLSLFMKNNPSLTRNQLRDNAMNMILAGRDTTRMLMTFLLVELCKKENQHIKEKVIAEVDAFDDTDGTGPGYSDFLKGFRYLEGALCETLRLNPSVPTIGREALRDFELPILDENGKNYMIRKGDDLLSVVYVSARTPRIWGDDCLEMKPERWAEKGVHTHDQFKFPHFFVGKRLCLGKQFAITESKTFMYHFLKNFNFERADDEPLELVSGVILNFRQKLNMRISLRK